MRRDNGGKVTLDRRGRALATYPNLLMSDKAVASGRVAGLCSVGGLLFPLFERIDAGHELFSGGLAGHIQQANWFWSTFDCPRLDSVGALAHDRAGQARQLHGDHQSDPRIVERGKHEPAGGHRLHGIGKA